MLYFEMSSDEEERKNSPSKEHKFKKCFQCLAYELEIDLSSWTAQDYGDLSSAYDAAFSDAQERQVFSSEDASRSMEALFDSFFEEEFETEELEKIYQSDVFKQFAQSFLSKVTSANRAKELHPKSTSRLSEKFGDDYFEGLGEDKEE